MPGHHAILSPSSSHRWITCPASVRLEASIPRPKESSSVYAEEGTSAHTLGEIEVSLAFGLIDRAQYHRKYAAWHKDAEAHGYDILEMELHVADYVALVAERVKLYPHSRIYVEKRVSTGVPECWGTSDIVIVSPVHIEVIDLKYGTGIRVGAERNPQLRLYAVGALEQYGDLLGDTELVRYTVFQPRLDSCETEETSATELRAWRDSLIPIAEDALNGSNQFGPSEEACRFCPAAGECRARIEAATAVDFATDPDLLTPEEMAELLEKLDEIKNFVKAFEEACLRKAYSEGTPLPGWKVVRSAGRRTISDSEGALAALLAADYDEAKVTRPAKPNLLTIGDLEKLLGKDLFAELVGPFVTKPEGSPALVREDDRREAIAPATEAAKDFA